MKGSKKFNRSNRYENDKRARRYVRRMIESGVPLQTLTKEFLSSSPTLRNFYTGKTTHPRQKDLSELIILYYNHIFTPPENSQSRHNNGKPRKNLNGRGNPNGDVKLNDHRSLNRNDNSNGHGRHIGHRDSNDQASRIGNVDQSDSVTPNGHDNLNAPSDTASFDAPVLHDPDGIAPMCVDSSDDAIMLSGNGSSGSAVIDIADVQATADEHDSPVPKTESVAGDEHMIEPIDDALSLLRARVYQNGIEILARDRDHFLEVENMKIDHIVQVSHDKIHEAKGQYSQCVSEEYEHAIERYRSQFSSLIERGNTETIIIAPSSLDTVLSYLLIVHAHLVRYGESGLQQRLEEVSLFNDRTRRTLEQYASERYNEDVEGLTHKIAGIHTLDELMQYDHLLLSYTEQPFQEFSLDVSLKHLDKVKRTSINQDRFIVRNTFSFPKLDHALRQAKYGKSKAVTDLSPEAVWCLMDCDFQRR